MYFMGGQYQGRRLPGAMGTRATADAKHLPCFERPAHKASLPVLGAVGRLLYVGQRALFRNLRVLKKLYLPEKECREIKNSYKNLSSVKVEGSREALAFQAAGVSPLLRSRPCWVQSPATTRSGPHSPLIDCSRCDLEACLYKFGPKKRKATAPRPEPSKVQVKGQRGANLRIRL
jgi:hypothetical protein